MRIEETCAWILHKRPISDNSYYVTFFTERLGIVVAFCRLSKKQQAILQQFTPMWIAFAEKLDKYYVNKIEVHGSSLNFRKDNLFAGLYINELLYHLLKQEDDNQNIFKLYQELLYLLQDATSKKSIETQLRIFEFKFLKEIGYGFNLSVESVTQQPVNADKYYKFIADKGVVLAERGFLGKYLLDIDKLDFTDNYALKIIKAINRCAIDYCLGGKVLRSRDLY